MFLRSSHGGAAVSKSVGRGFDSFRACAPDIRSGYQHFDNRIGIACWGQSRLAPSWVGRAMGCSWL